MNLAAGKKAKASAAFEPAFAYLTAGMQFLTEERWVKQYDLTLELYIGASEAAYLTAKFEEMERLAGEVMSFAKTALDKVKVYEVLIFAYIYQSDLAKALRTGMAALRLLGTKLPANANKIHIAIAFVRTKLALAGTAIEDLIYLPVMKEPHAQAQMRIISSMGTAAYSVSKNLLVLMVLKSIKLSVKYGNSPMSGFAYAAYGMALCNNLGNVESGYQFGKLALNVLERFNDKRNRARTCIVYYNFINFWKEHVRGELKTILSVYHGAMEVGDFEWSAHSLLIYSYLSYLVGNELKPLELEMRNYGDAIAHLTKGTPHNAFNVWRQAIVNISGEGKSPFLLIGKHYDERKMVQIHLDTKDQTTIFMLYLNKVMLCVLFQQDEMALEATIQGEKYVDSQGALTGFYFRFYASLAYLSMFSSAQTHEKKRILKKVFLNQKKMKRWAEQAPMNGAHKYFLVQAEIFKAQKSDLEAINFYDKSIELARQNKYLNEEALANELAARFYLSRGRERVAGLYMNYARYCYLKWGAQAKVKQLDENYADLLNNQEKRTSLEQPTPATGVLESLDLVSFIKASQTISREIILERLLSKLMGIVIENAGAQKGYLALEHDGGWFIEAESTLEQENCTVLQSIPVDSVDKESGCSLLPIAIVQYVIRTGKKVVIEDACSDENYCNDIYIALRRPKSVLCMPLNNQGKVDGLLYVENNLTAGAFTQERLEVLALLSSQIAISIDNARNYLEINDLNGNLEQKVEERTRELRVKNRHIMDSIHYAKTIQQSILPRDERISEFCAKHFVIWKPRDVVGGDFYYFEGFSNNYLIAVIDCTGHGVPGAFMTMTTHSILNRITDDICQDDPARILRELNFFIRATLNQDVSSNLSDDGLDIGLCYVKPDEKILLYAGAMISLYYCKNGDILEVKADRQSIGYKKSNVEHRYINHELTLEGNEVFYICSDGYFHQGGGEKGFSFGKERLKRIWLENHKKPMSEQKVTIQQELQDYQGREPQRDDITLLGFSVN